MQQVTDSWDADIDQQADAALSQLKRSGDIDADLIGVLDIAIGMTDADIGTLQRLDEHEDYLKLVAGRGLSASALTFFDIVRRHTNSTCAAAFTQRMRVFAEDVSTSYLFVGTRELELMIAEGITTAQSTPLISSTGRLWGVVSTHFRQLHQENAFNHGPLDRLAVRIADILELRESLNGNRLQPGRPVEGD